MVGKNRIEQIFIIWAIDEKAVSEFEVKPFNWHNCFLFSHWFLYASFFNAGEEGGGFETEEFSGPAGALDFPACFV